MRDEDFYFEESNPKKVFLWCLIILFFIGAGAGIYYYLDQQVSLKLKDVTVELGSKVPTDINKFITGKNINPKDYELDITKVHVDENGNTDSVGEYSYKITKGTESKRGKIYVKDRKAPLVEVQDLTIGLDEEYSPEDFIVSCEDLSGECLVSFSKDRFANHSNKEGKYEITLTIKDEYDNYVNKKVELNVSKNASVSGLKSSDLEVAKISPKDEEWNNNFTYKFDKGYFEDSEKIDEIYLEIANTNYEEKYKKKLVEDPHIILIYNRYNYVIGLAVRLNFDDNTHIYATL